MCGTSNRSCDTCFSVLRFGDGYMITVRTKSSSNVKEVVRFFNRNFPDAVLKVRREICTITTEALFL